MDEFLYSFKRRFNCRWSGLYATTWFVSLVLIGMTIAVPKLAILTLIPIIFFQCMFWFG